MYVTLTGNDEWANLNISDLHLVLLDLPAASVGIPKDVPAYTLSQKTQVEYPTMQAIPGNIISSLCALAACKNVPRPKHLRRLATERHFRGHHKF